MMTIENDVIINKVTTIEKCLKRLNQTYKGESTDLEDFDIQDILILNLQRACQASIDLAMHICVKEKLGFPQSGIDAFDFLHTGKILNHDILEKMKELIEFRNTAVHDYQSLNLNILRSILDKHLSDFTDFTALILKTIEVD